MTDAERQCRAIMDEYARLERVQRAARKAAGLDTVAHDGEVVGEDDPSVGHEPTERMGY